MKRLEAAARLLGRVNNLYDIGCDHGYLSFDMLKSGQAQRVHLRDISAKALAHAKTTFLGVDGEKCTFTVADGLRGCAPQAGDGVAICGMGGRSALAILQQLPPLAANVVVQVNSELDVLRNGLAAHGYAICEEDLVLEAGRYYTLMRLAPGNMTLSPLEALVGPKLLQNPPALMREWLCRQIDVFTKAHSAAHGEKAEALWGPLCLYKEALACLE